MSIYIAGVIIGAAVGGLAGIVVLRLHSRIGKLEVELTELQAVADSNLMAHGMPPIFAPRYGLDLAIDPAKMPPPNLHGAKDQVCVICGAPGAILCDAHR